MARIQLNVNKNIIYLNMIRVSVLPNSAVETTMKISFDRRHQCTMRYRPLTKYYVPETSNMFSQ